MNSFPQSFFELGSLPGIFSVESSCWLVVQSDFSYELRTLAVPLAFVLFPVLEFPIGGQFVVLGNRAAASSTPLAS